MSPMNVEKLQASPEPLPLDLWCLLLFIPCLPTLESSIYMSNPNGRELLCSPLSCFCECCALDMRMHTLWSTHTYHSGDMLCCSLSICG